MNYQNYVEMNHPVRMAVYLKIDITGDDLADILGYEDVDAMRYNMTDKDAKLCKYLAGPHGYAIYRMMKAKKSAT